eukprot:2902969-Alexandrium_andersonii.AAC.1
MCSGNDVMQFVFRAVEDGLRSIGHEVAFSQRFRCEIDKAKRDWGRNVEAAAEADTPSCSFGDIADLSGAAAHCHTHHCKCPVPR